jgi:hypothetical protein
MAARCSSPALGELGVVRDKASIVFDAGEWHSAVASRTTDDGTPCFITIDPTIDGLESVVADLPSERRLITRDAQHEYLFVEEASAARP